MIRCRLLTEDGRSLAATLFEPQIVRAAVIVCAGVGIRKEFYAGFARFLANAGLAVLCFDYRGVGDSIEGSVRRDGARLRDWGRIDLPAAIRWMRGRYPRLPLLAVGHSAGVQMVGLAGNNSELVGCFGVAGQHGYWRWWAGVPRMRAWSLFFCLIPLSVLFFGYFPGRRLGIADLPRGVASEWANWCRRGGFVLSALEQDGVPEFFSRYSGSMTLLSVYDDELYAPERAVDELAKLFIRAVPRRRHVTAGDVGGRAVGHFGFFRPACRESLWSECLAWVNQTLSQNVTPHTNDSKEASLD